LSEKHKTQRQTFDFFLSNSEQVLSGIDPGARSRAPFAFDSEKFGIQVAPE